MRTKQGAFGEEAIAEKTPDIVLHRAETIRL
jgi:hypothetical protein